VIDAVLRASSIVTAIALTCGLAAWMVQPGGRGSDLVLNAGLLLLMAMPVVQLVSAIGEEIRAREWRFAIVGAAALLLLGGSLAVSLIG
jgi:uncharacterized membrane protein